MAVLLAAVVLSLLITWVGISIAGVVIVGVFWAIVWAIMRAVDRAENEKLGLPADFGLSWTKRDSMKRFGY